ncbi:MAG TPA: phosphoribosyl-AMP cyclohydrolase [Syntrophus sp. (in: bacteria)]|jgi:phosphoribosyl-AMP cyclohydrolase|nr:phosphoribosyl-AMP cyclohydrolase [Syntrophus sp. (in: bacteria)]
MTEPDFEKGDGLIPVIVQESETGEVLMLAYMNAEAWRETLRTGKATYWSRSRQTLWVKGESSGHVQWVQEIRIDCDRDTLLLRVRQVGDAACHTGYRSCFYRKLSPGSEAIVGERIFDPETVYKKG